MTSLPSAYVKSASPPEKSAHQDKLIMPQRRESGARVNMLTTAIFPPWSQCAAVGSASVREKVQSKLTPFIRGTNAMIGLHLSESVGTQCVKKIEDGIELIAKEWRSL